MGCPPRVQSALSSLDGVENVDVDFATKTATVKLDGKVSVADMVAALEGAGFSGSVTE
ncbi:MAG: copper chaperone CopZ [Planctomycetota bacterium]|jgi:copper chaperone CopZ